MTALSATLLAGVLGCAGNAPSPESTTPESASETPTETTPATSAEASAEGTLQLKANGEDFVRQGFTSKDGWQIQFDHVYVNLSQVTAYQTDPPFDPEGETPLTPVQEVPLVEQQTVDLAEGEATAEPILMAEMPAPAGRYNAIAWTMSPATEGPAAGAVLMLVGTATKDGQTINFTLRLDQEATYLCGDFVGDERKGILAADGTADLEATFHFDHIFGDGEAAPEDEINTGALGFDPLAAIAQNGQLEIDQATLKTQLSAADYALLEETVAGLAHVGEGHCALQS